MNAISDFIAIIFERHELGQFVFNFSLNSLLLTLLSSLPSVQDFFSIHSGLNRPCLSVPSSLSIVFENKGHSVCSNRFIRI